MSLTIPNSFHQSISGKIDGMRLTWNFTKEAIQQDGFFAELFPCGIKTNGSKGQVMKIYNFLSGKLLYFWDRKHEKFTIQYMTLNCFIGYVRIILPGAVNENYPWQVAPLSIAGSFSQLKTMIC